MNSESNAHIHTSMCPIMFFPFHFILKGKYSSIDRHFRIIFELGENGKKFSCNIDMITLRCTEAISLHFLPQMTTFSRFVCSSRVPPLFSPISMAAHQILAPPLYNKDSYASVHIHLKNFLQIYLQKGSWMEGPFLLSHFIFLRNTNITFQALFDKIPMPLVHLNSNAHQYTYFYVFLVLIQYYVKHQHLIMKISMSQCCF